MSDIQKVGLNFISVDEILEKGLMRVMEEAYEQEDIVEIPIKYYYVDRITMLPDDPKPVADKPLWVLQQENKRPRR